jgi:acetyltransferase-like isoleucine patch superfamily enzyme
MVGAWVRSSGSFGARVRRRLQLGGVRGHVLGLLLRLRLRRSGVLVVMGGWHLPEIDDRGGTIVVGDCGFFPGVRLECWRGATIVIGDGTYLNRNTEIVAAGSVAIGNQCKIGRDVLIMDTDQHPLPGRAHVDPVRIEDGVWIGARAIVLKGVTIGRGAIVGAGAIVTRNVPPYSVVAGHPARVLRSFDRQSREAGTVESDTLVAL